ncbi:hypothetical protein PNW85_19755 [[Ruminococcus] gnavus]|uniref:Transposase n=1 Tax=Mediterraneibacter gnavus TaxID=33038 RepID=A0AAW6DPD7_MEDGN|nr:hypothetical protein [Mediterraneibacter gnavus]MDB8681653.1 hypothetical protein [Mediterraneibacter gnavus]MDB8688832.1 hypothetical protein [Mediterraneibacter gnavus]MDB8692704.1 hypothetical protein [Mediterraneibacter gnavus]
MKPSDFQKAVQCRFESCLKKVVRHVVKDYQQGLKRRKEKETSFCELPDIIVEKFSSWDEYETDYTAFYVCGMDIRVYVIRQIKRCRFRQIKTGLSEHLTMG